MQNKNAKVACLVTPVRLPTVSDPSCGSGGLLQEETAGALQGTTAVIESEHSDFASLERSTLATTTPIKVKLIGWASWIATVLRGLA